MPVRANTNALQLYNIVNIEGRKVTSCYFTSGAKVKKE